MTYAVLNLTYAGDNIVALSTLYGGTYALFAHTLPQYGIEVRFVDPGKPEELAALVDEKTKLVFGETIGNPLVNVVDLDAWSAAGVLGGRMDGHVDTVVEHPAQVGRRHRVVHDQGDAVGMGQSAMAPISATLPAGLPMDSQKTALVRPSMRAAMPAMSLGAAKRTSMPNCGKVWAKRL